MREFIYNNKPKELCYGCRACEHICPKEAITIAPDHEGFIYPSIDPNKCIDCGLCEKVCPTQDANKDKLLHGEKSTVYAAWNTDLALRMKSTSGGMFYTLASRFIEEAGVVYGAKMDKDLTAYQCRVTSIEELAALRGSKYMQSNTRDTFVMVKNDLTSGLKVLYSGTPCQIAGLRSFLRKDYAHLFTIDLVCHGTPSPTIFKQHIHYIEQCEGKTLKAFYFRDKKPSGWRAYVSYVFSNGKEKHLITEKDFYFRAFCAGWLNRESCFLCQYSQSRRVGDITLSDFWGAEKTIKALRIQRKHGYNLVVCNTEKGQNLFDSVSDRIEKIETTMEIAKQGDVRLRHAEEKPSLRNRIYRECEEKGYGYVVEKYKYRPSLFRRLVPLWVINVMKEIKAKL